MKTTSLGRLTLTALFAAVICLTTAYLLHIPVGNGYVHLGDAFIYIAAACLPAPYAIAASAIGSGLADLLSGAPQWILFTVVIKGVMPLMFTDKKDTIVCKRNILGSVLAGVVCIVGYYFAEVLLYGNWITPLLGIPFGGLVQSGSAIVLFLVGGALLDRAKLKQQLRRL